MVVLLCPLWEEILLRKPILANLSRVSGRISFIMKPFVHTADIHELETLLKKLPDAIHVLPIAILVFNLRNWNATPNLFHPLIP